MITHIWMLMRLMHNAYLMHAALHKTYMIHIYTHIYIYTHTHIWYISLWDAWDILCNVRLISLCIKKIWHNEMRLDVTLWGVTLKYGTMRRVSLCHISMWRLTMSHRDASHCAISYAMQHSYMHILCMIYRVIAHIYKWVFIYVSASCIIWRISYRQLDL